MTANRIEGTVSVVLGDGSGGFGAPRAFDVAASPQSVELGDFDGDGALDVATANFDGLGSPINGVSVLRGRGDGSLAAPIELAIGGSAVSIDVGDLDGDGLDEIVMTDGFTGIWVFPNQSGTTPGPARVPQSATSTPAGAAPTLSLRVRSEGHDHAVIEYATTEAALVRLTVFDVAGRQVAAVDAGARGAGTHALTLPTRGMPRGVYFCRLQAGVLRATRSLIVRH